MKTLRHTGIGDPGRLLLRRLSIDDSEMMFNNWASDPR